MAFWPPCGRRPMCLRNIFIVNIPCRVSLFLAPGRRVVLAPSFSQSASQRSRPFWLLSGPRGPYSLLSFSLLLAAAWPFRPGIESNTLGSSVPAVFFAVLFYDAMLYAFLSLCHSPLSWPCAQRSAGNLGISWHCFTEPIHYPALPKGAWLATGSLSSATEPLDSGLGPIYFADSCDLLLATSTFVFQFSHPVLLAFSFCPGMVSNSGCSCIVSHVLLKRLPSHPLPNILAEVWGFEAVTMLTHCRRMPSAFVQLENLSSVFLLCLLATATGHVEGSPQNLPVCPFVHPSVFQRSTLLCLLPAASVQLAGQASPKLTAWR